MIRPQSLPRHPRSAATVAAGLLLLAAGLADSSSSSAMTAKGASGLGSKTPAEIVAAAQSALRSAHGYLITGRMREAKQKLDLRVTYGGASKLEMQIREGGDTAAIIVLPGAAYVKADKAYWRSQGGASLVSYANRWIQLPATYSSQFTKQLGPFNPKTVAMCLAEDHGKLTVAGTTTVSGKRAVVVRDAGGVPGGSPGVLYVAASGPAYPLRLESTGPTLKGGKVDVCNDGKGGDLVGVINFSRFNDPPPIKAPANPINLSTTTSTSTTTTS